MKILVIGDVILDHFILGSVEKISPEAPVPVLRYADEYFRLGGAANVAANISALSGSQTRLIGLCGSDRNASALDELLVDKNIKSLLVKSKDYPTITKTRMISLNNSKQQLLRLDQEKTVVSAIDLEQLEQVFISELPNADIIVFSDYNKGCLNNLPELIAIAKKHNKIVIADPKKTDPEVYKNADIITPNLKELNSFTGLKQCAEIERAQEIISRFNIKNIALTRSEKGMALINSKAVELVPAVKNGIEVIDVTGAGDSFIAGVAVGLADGMDLLTACKYANDIAGIAVTKFGTYVVSKAEIKKEQKIYELSSLVENLTELKQQKKTIVFTNGCFDVLHSGHVELLQQAKSLGDILVVGVNSDTSVSKLKGSNRPVNTIKHRLKVLSALEMVDHLVVFEQETPIDIIKSISPDVLIKGGDYQSKAEIVGSEHVESYGGKIVFGRFVKGQSTTRILKDLKE